MLGIAAPTAGRFLAALSRASVVLTDGAGTAYLAGLMRAPSLLVSVSGRPLPPPRARCQALTAARYDAVTADAVYDAACKLIRRERSGSLFQ